MEKFLEELNENQLEAVKNTEGYIRVIAGAGSGKTKTLISRYIYLVKNIGISPSNILCVTFTNKATNEMRKRIRKIIGDADTSLICTFHGFCAYMLREDIHVLNYPKQFAIIDEDDSESILKSIYEKLDIDSSYISFYGAKKLIYDYKKQNTYIDYLMDKNYTYIKEQYENEQLELSERIIYGYLYEQRKFFGLDYNDLILFALKILTTNKEKLSKWQKRFMYVMVDEFQDVSKRQNLLCELLSEYHKNLFIVGDPDQTIYTWRGALIDLIMNFDKVHPDCKNITLNKNYRSTSNILKVSNALINKNVKRMPKELLAINNDGIVVSYNHAKTTKEEADWISLEIKKLIQNGYTFNDIAILYRAHFVSRTIEQSFIEKNIKYSIFNGVEFFKRKEIKDVLSYLRMIIYADDLSFTRIINVPKRNFGKKRMDIIKEYAENNNLSLYQSLKENINNELIKQTDAIKFIETIDKFKDIYNNMKVSDIFSQILDESGYEEYLRTLSDDDRLNNVSELKNTIKEFEKNNQEDTNLEEYLNTISLYTDLDVKNVQDSVKMMTIHSAKGLEFPIVFICGLNEGIFPSNKIKTYDELEEERRIAYVAFTRAQKILFLSDAEGYNYDNTFRYPSRFIFNIGKENLNYVVELEEKLYQESFENIEERENSLINYQRIFEIDDVIKHELLGIGKIVSIDNGKMSYEIKFDGLDTNRNIGFCAPLELINNIDNSSNNNVLNKYDVNDIKEKNETIKESKIKDKKTLISKIFKKNK